MRGRIVIAGSLAQRPGRGGHCWVFLQYLLGFRRLGWDVFFLDRLEPEMCRDADGCPCDPEQSENLRHFREVMERFGLGDSFALACDRGQYWAGLSRGAIRERVKDSALLLNVMGFCDDEDILYSAPRQVFLDIDPGFAQMWKDLGLADVFRGHDDYVTIGENIGRSDCAIPTCGLEWITTPQPVVLDQWPAQANAGGDALTSIVSWRGTFGPVEYRGKTYGLRAHEFRKFAPLPRFTGAPFRLALDLHPAEARDRALLTENGWLMVDPKEVAGDPWAYRSFIQGSRGEFMVAKNMYVQSNSGWLSDRSLCYLASSRPVLAQDTGFRHRYPTGEGLFAFSTLDEARAGVEAIRSDPERHARAARALAEEYFDSDKVLTRLLEELGVA
jgi:hypothetical protein